MLNQAIKYYGSKASFAHRYAMPKCDTIIEPFAGGASYALRYPWHKVILSDLDDRLIAVWRYLTASSAPTKVRRLPILQIGQVVNDLSELCDEERWIIGWWIHTGDHAPRSKPSPHCCNGAGFWGEERRERLAVLSSSISHWDVRKCSFLDLPNVRATWFVDPPYSKAGKRYKHGSDKLDFGALGDWCRSRRGQVIVCENEGAAWLPFERLCEVNGVARKTSVEVAWNGP